MKTRSLVSALVLGLLLAASGVAKATVVTFKEESDIPELGVTNYLGCGDTSLNAGTNTWGTGRRSNYGGCEWIGVARDGSAAWNASGSEYKGLIRFDVSALNGQYTAINSVTLRLYVETPDAGGGTFDVQRISDYNSVWSEGTHCGGLLWGPNDGNRTSWEYVYGSSQPWAGSMGGETAFSDYDFPALATVTAPGGGWAANQAVDISLPVDLIDDWCVATPFALGNGAGDWWFDPSGGTPSHPGDESANEGLFLASTSAEANYFWASGAATDAYHPELIVDYEPSSGGVVPEPAAVGMIGLALLALRRRRS